VTTERADQFVGCLACVLFAAVLAGCDDSRTQAQRHSHTSAKVRSGAKELGHDTERAFRKVGGHLQKFFTGRDTITR
jgi:hypothetical protein